MMLTSLVQVRYGGHVKQKKFSSGCHGTLGANRPQYAHSPSTSPNLHCNRKQLFDYTNKKALYLKNLPVTKPSVYVCLDTTLLCNYPNHFLESKKFSNLLKYNAIHF